MTRRLRTHWVIWGSLVLILVCGSVLCSISSSRSTASIELVPNASIDISVFRPLPDALRLSLRFDRLKEQQRPELGRSTYRGDMKKTGYIEYVDPGAPIKLLVNCEGKSVVYEAEPAGSYSATTIGRNLVPFVDDGNPNHFPWPSVLALRHQLPAGSSHLTVTVLEVGNQLLGEKAKLIVEPPVTLKEVAPSYGYIWWFMFWPLYAPLLLIYCLVLVWQSQQTLSNRVGKDVSPQSGSRSSS